ncbi:Rpn family recombination-promoting nuclease/putative transposase [Prosthecobacter sp. SYSU 5D2]|uniref:Rpn family recombination-promoting nuclease/putative transposase n=1 Tax=Prosthecobacter sp. SYSU 5D2 TaxID=3134134 RepID=UPI0031FEF24E
MIEPDEDLLASQPNDAYFKEVFSQPVYAATFFRQHLPAEIVEGIHWDTLALLPASFVKQNLQQTHSDLLFSADMGGKEALLYLLFEHQTTPDPLMPLRLLGYVLEILQQHEQAHGLPLPPVIPFVLHQGPLRWTPSTAFEDLFELPEGQAQALLPFLPKFRHALLDLSLFDPAAEETDTQMRVVLQLMKLAREKKLIEFFTWMATEIVLKSMPEDLLRLSLLYALHADTNLDVEEIAHTLELNHELRENTMSIAQKLHSRGKAEGKAEGKLQLLQTLMGLPVSTDAELAGLSTSELESRFEELEQRYKTEFKRL